MLKFKSIALSMGFLGTFAAMSSGYAMECEEKSNSTTSSSLPTMNVRADWSSDMVYVSTRKGQTGIKWERPHPPIYIDKEEASKYDLEIFKAVKPTPLIIDGKIYQYINDEKVILGNKTTTMQDLLMDYSTFRECSRSSHEDENTKHFDAMDITFPKLNKYKDIVLNEKGTNFIGASDEIIAEFKEFRKLKIFIANKLHEKYADGSLRGFN